MSLQLLLSYSPTRLRYNTNFFKNPYTIQTYAARSSSCKFFVPIYRHEALQNLRQSNSNLPNRIEFIDLAVITHQILSSLNLAAQLLFPLFLRPPIVCLFVQDFQVKWFLSGKKSGLFSFHLPLPAPGAAAAGQQAAAARQPWWRGGIGGSRWCSPPRRRCSTRSRGTARRRRRRSRCASGPASSASRPGAAPSSGSSHPSSPSPRQRSEGSRSSPARLYVPPVSTRPRTQLFVANCIVRAAKFDPLGASLRKLRLLLS